MTGERWLPIGGWEGLYSVSDHGRVRSEPRDNCGGRRGQAHRPASIRRPTPNVSGMPVILLTRGARRRNVAISVLVWEAFVDVVPKEKSVRMRDGNLANSRLDNLNLETRISGRQIGVSRPLLGGKIATSEVAKIRTRLAQGEKGSAIAKEYGVSKVAISAIKTGRRRAN